MRQRVAPNEILFLQIHQLAEANFKGRIFLRVDQRLFAGHIVDFNQDEPRLDARDVQSNHTRGMNVEGFALGDERVPDFDGVNPGHPDFKAEIAGVAGAGNVHGNARDFSVRNAKIFQIVDRGVGHFAQNSA